mgnify:CR=1 FL=1
MWSVTLNMMKKNLRMLIPAGIAILIGTAFIAATLLFTNALDTSMRERTTAQYGGANYAVVHNNDDTSTDSAPVTVGQMNVPAIEQVNGVEGVRTDADIEVMLSTADAHSSDIVLSTTSDAKLLPIEIVGGKQPDPNGQQQIAIPQRLAKQWNLKVGDSITTRMQYGNDPHDITATIVGLTNDPNNVYGYYNGASVVSNDLMSAYYGVQSFNDVPASNAYLYITPSQETAAVSQLKSVLPKGYGVETRAHLEDEAIKSMSSNGGDVTKQFLLSFGVLALVVAALVIANTFQVLVAQRRRTLALLRTIGATKRQLYVSVLQEAGILGFVSSLLGVGAGIGLMAIVSAVTKQQGTMLAGGSITLNITAQVFIVPLLFGVIMTVLASMGAARAATNVTPLEAMRPLELSNQHKSRMGRAIFGLLFLIVGIGLMVASIPMGKSTNDSVAVTALLLAILGCALTFIGLAMTSIFWLPWLMKGIGSLAGLFGPSAKIANANIQKNPRRIAATGTALLIGVTLISTLATGAAAAKATMNQALDTRYSVDVVVTGSSIPDEAVTKVLSEKGVKTGIRVKTANAQFSNDGKEVDTEVIGVPNTAALQSVLNVNIGDAKLDATDAIMPLNDSSTGKALTFANNKVTLEETKTDSDGAPAATGKSVELNVEQRDFHRVSQASAVAFVNSSLFDNGTFTATGDMLLLKLAVQPDQSLSEVFESIQKDLNAYSDVSVGGPVAERSMWESMVNMMLMLLVALLAVAVIIAIIGVANTLSLSVIERTRESATLRAIGMTRGQLKRSLAIEALLISVVTSVVGMVVGTLFGWLGIYLVMNSIAPVVYVIDWSTYGIILVIAIVCALLASVFPARRAVKTPPVEALAEA